MKSTEEQLLSTFVETLIQHRIEEQSEVHKKETIELNRQLHFESEKYLNLQRKLTALCDTFNNSLLCLEDWESIKPITCKHFLIEFKKTISKCIKDYDIHYNSQKQAE